MINTLTFNTLHRLSNLVGTEYAHNIGHSISAAPANEQQIADILRFANESRLIVTPIGGGTKQNWGNSVSPAIYMSLARIESLRDHAWQDMTCSVDAGCTWSTMQNALAQHGQMVALDPLSPDQATIGGIVSTNDSGCLRLKYGGLRDLIIGMTVVIADGTIAKTGGKVVKNVAGYDLHKLMCGSFGTLGVIAEVNFRLHPLEQYAQSWSIEALKATSLDAPLRALLNSQIALSCLQLRSAEETFSLDLRIASSIPLSRIKAICGSLNVQPANEDVWQTRQSLFDKRDCVLLKVSILPSQITQITERLHKWSAESATQIHTAAQATGLITVALAATPAIAALVQRLRTLLHLTGGSAIVLHLPESLATVLDLWDSQSDALPLMHEIKRRFDPNRILNPGRFVGGL